MFNINDIKVVLFDMDGVLYNSMPNHAVAWVNAMKTFGIDMTELDAYLTEGQRGIDTIRQMVTQQKGEDISEATAQAMYDEKARLFHLMPIAPVFDGVTDLMGKLKSRGITIGIVTGSGQRPLIDRLAADFGQYVEPQHIITAYDVKRGKPAPDPYLMGLERTGGFLPSQAMVVENAPMGIRAGVAAGCFTVAVNSGPLPDQTLLDEGAHLLVHSIRQLSDMI